MADKNLLQDYSKNYFEAFETEKDKADAFFEQKKLLAKKIYDAYIELAHLDEEKIYEIAKHFNMGEIIGSKFREGFNIDEFKFDVMFVLYGSSAIGPRKISKYPRKQDSDILLIPDIVDEKKNEGYFSIKIAILLDAILEHLHLEKAAGKNITTPVVYEFIQDNLPKFFSLIEEIKVKGESIDLNIPDFPDENGQTGDWKKLVGPNKVLFKTSDHLDKSYKYLQDAAIKTALDENYGIHDLIDLQMD